jgi:glycerol kinase
VISIDISLYYFAYLAWSDPIAPPIAPFDIDAIGIDNQGETVIAWDCQRGLFIYNAIVWQDQRTTYFIEELKAKGAEEITLRLAGLPLDPLFFRLQAALDSEKR